MGEFGSVVVMGEFGPDNRNLKLTATEGNTAVVPCHPPPGLPPPVVSFQLNGANINQASGKCITV